MTCSYTFHSICIILSFTLLRLFFFFFFFNDTATTEIYTLSLHDALPIYLGPESKQARRRSSARTLATSRREVPSFCSQGDRKSTRLNSSHSQISYAVFCLKKKKKNTLRIKCFNHLPVDDKYKSKKE